MSSAFRFQDIFVRGVQDPYPFYHWLRTEAPVYWNAEILPAWFISRYDDVVAITEGDRRIGRGLPGLQVGAVQVPESR